MMVGPPISHALRMNIGTLLFAMVQEGWTTILGRDFNVCINCSCRYDGALVQINFMLLGRGLEQFPMSII